MLFNHNLFDEPSDKDKSDFRMRNIPFSYYNSQLIEECDIEGEDKKDKEENSERTLKERIETQIKTKYNLIIPAILIEIQETGINSIQLLKDDLRNLLTSLGGIKHIEINSNIAYVLYEHYFSALLGFNILNDIITREKKNFITVKLFTKEEDEEKQKKVHIQSFPIQSSLSKRSSNCVSIETKKSLLGFIDTTKNMSLTKGGTEKGTEEDNLTLPESLFDGFLRLEIESKKLIEEEKKNPSDSNEIPLFYGNRNAINQNLYSSQIIPVPIFHPFPINQIDGFFPFNISFNQLNLIKFVCNYDIQIENDSQFRVTKRLIGYKGFALKKILLDSCIKFGDNSTKIRLRGKGSGYKEGTTCQESEDPLQLCISSLNLEAYTRCFEAVEKLLNLIYIDYFNFLFANKRLVEATPKRIIKYEYMVNRY